MKCYPVVLCLLLPVLLLGGCGAKNEFAVREVVPLVNRSTKVAGLDKYVYEFSRLDSKNLEPAEPFVPFARELIKGHIDSVDHNTNSSMWLIRSHSGSGYYDGQKLYLYSDQSDSLNEVKAFGEKRIDCPVLAFREQGPEGYILASVWPPHTHWWMTELWTNNLGTGALGRMAAGGNCKIAPDHSHAAFWRTDGTGFHSLHIWDVNSGTVEDVISVWEADPGSGTSWDWNWSGDSKALGIKGTCSGFRRREGRASGSRRLNLVYIVAERKMFDVSDIP
jgi:hypothetical protein